METALHRQRERVLARPGGLTRAAFLRAPALRSPTRNSASWASWPSLVDSAGPWAGAALGLGLDPTAWNVTGRPGGRLGFLHCPLAALTFS